MTIQNSPFLNDATKVLERLPVVMARTGRAKSSIYKDIRAGKFPKPIRTSCRTVAWRASDVNAWIDTQIAKHQALQASETTVDTQTAA